MVIVWFSQHFFIVINLDTFVIYAECSYIILQIGTGYNIQKTFKIHLISINKFCVGIFRIIAVYFVHAFEVEGAFFLPNEVCTFFVSVFPCFLNFISQGTIALEFLEQVPDLDAILVPVSGGGMISGIAIAAKAIKPDIKGTVKVMCITSKLQWVMCFTLSR